jgi:hypothetical protein
VVPLQQAVPLPETGWQGLEIAERFPLDEIAKAHEFVEHPTKSGRVIVNDLTLNGGQPLSWWDRNQMVDDQTPD